MDRTNDAIFGRLFDSVPVQSLSSNTHHRTLQKVVLKSVFIVLECSYRSPNNKTKCTTTSAKHEKYTNSRDDVLLNHYPVPT